MRISRCGLPLLDRNIGYENGGGTYDRFMFGNYLLIINWLNC